jgi:tRNA(Met) C34 N-acetyltransferase TmcA
LFSSREDGDEGKRTDFLGVGFGNPSKLIHFLVREGIRYFRVKISFLRVG